jgi:glutamate N-acetyltransferase/amino-acid N-acetyltransferase
MNIKGFKFSAVEAAIKKPGRLDVGLIVSEIPAATAAVFTTNKVKAAPVLLCMEHLKSGTARAIVVNSGNANACTGAQGMDDARETARLVAENLGVETGAVLVSSTGVIGQQMPMERVRSAVPTLVAGLESGTLEGVSQAIMTTDTFPKLEVRSGSVGGESYTIAGVAKGAGMIMPNMATMLSFVVTDAAVDPGWLQTLLRDSVDASFNVISVDGDMSTNDTVIFMANGAAGNPPLQAGTPEGQAFAAQLHDLLLALAKLIVKDGEGATKFVTVKVAGARSNADAKLAAMSIANSCLVKTAFFGQDANWGRIIAAVGYSGAEVDPQRIAIFFDDVQMVQGGVFTGGDAENRGSTVLQKAEFMVTVDLRIADGHATVYTSDLSYDYVKINADYRT